MTFIQKNQSHKNFHVSPTRHNHHTFIEIHESAINHNISYYKNHIGSHNQLALVIKGNAYGHGLVNIGLIAQKNDLVDWLCIAHYAEALTLLEVGVTKNILILGYAVITNVPTSLSTIHFMVDSFEYASYLNSIGQQYNQFLYVHIKIDTGLSRFGISPTEISNFIEQLNTLKYIKLSGIFSHFVASDNNNILTNNQLQLFSNTVKSLQKNNIFIHLSNTGSVTQLNYPSFFNLFRIGLGLYGFGNNEQYLKSALTWKTHIIAIKTIPPHSYVSYACSYKTTRTTRIGLLPVGYDDGYQLRFSNKTWVLINGAHAPVIGRVGMNTTIIDITECTAFIGDEVILIGSPKKVRVTDIAQLADIYNVREILTSIHPAIERITK